MHLKQCMEKVQETPKTRNKEALSGVNAFLGPGLAEFT